MTNLFPYVQKMVELLTNEYYDLKYKKGAENMIVTIGRQHGSNGREIAELLAKKLNVKCYDKEIVDEAANHSDFSRELIDSFDEKRMSALHLPVMSYGPNINMQVVTAQFETIESIADSGSCVFVGRCADYVLRSRQDVIKVFILGDMDARIKTIAKRQSITEQAAKKKIKEVDKDRSSYYRYYSEQVWGDAQNYDICINSSKLGVEKTVDVILSYINARE